MKKRSPPPAAGEALHHRLNPEQRAVVAHPFGFHALVCAGADLENVRALVDDYVQLDDAERRRFDGQLIAAATTAQQRLLTASPQARGLPRGWEGVF